MLVGDLLIYKTLKLQKMQEKKEKEKKKPCLITCAQLCSLICLLALSVIQLYIILFMSTLG